MGLLMEPIRSSYEPPGRSVLPIEPAKRVSPVKSAPSSSMYMDIPPLVWPGVWIMLTSIAPALIVSPVLERYVRLRLGIDVQTEETALHRGCPESGASRPCMAMAAPVIAFYLGVRPYVVEMPVRVYDVFDVEPAPLTSSAIIAASPPGSTTKAESVSLVPHHVTIHVQRPHDKP